MKGIPSIAGLSKEDVEAKVKELAADDDIVAECAIRSMIFLQHIKHQFRQGKVKNGNDLVQAFNSGLAALNDD